MKKDCQPSLRGQRRHGKDSVEIVQRSLPIASPQFLDAAVDQRICSVFLRHVVE
jgi:hypothetical protein